MKIKLSSGKELEPLMATGGQQYVQGQSRDTLSFVFGEDADMAELDQAFQPENCGDIILTDDQGATSWKRPAWRASPPPPRARPSM